MDLENKKQYAGEATKDFERMAEEYDVEFPIPPQEKNMKRFKWTIIALLVAAVILFSQSAGADICWYTEGVPCKDSL